MNLLKHNILLWKCFIAKLADFQTPSSLFIMTNMIVEGNVQTINMLTILMKQYRDN